jgi:hypothetical protein
MNTSFEDIMRRIIREEVEAALATIVHAVTPTAPAPVPPKLEGVDRRQHYSIAAAAKLLQVSGDYVYDRIKDGSIVKVVELGSGQAKQRISGLELDRFISERSFSRRT